MQALYHHDAAESKGRHLCSFSNPWQGPGRWSRRLTQSLDVASICRDSSVVVTDVFSEVAFVDDHNASALILRVSLPSHLISWARGTRWLVPEIFTQVLAPFSGIVSPRSVIESGTETSSVSLPDEV